MLKTAVSGSTWTLHTDDRLSYASIAVTCWLHVLRMRTNASWLRRVMWLLLVWPHVNEIWPLQTLPCCITRLNRIRLHWVTHGCSKHYHVVSHVVLSDSATFTFYVASSETIISCVTWLLLIPPCGPTFMLLKFFICFKRQPFFHILIL